jgi:hypothetical protein
MAVSYNARLLIGSFMQQYSLLRCGSTLDSFATFIRQSTRSKGSYSKV